MTALPVTTSEPAKAAFADLKPGTKLYDFLFGFPLAVWYGVGVCVQVPLLLQALAAAMRPHADPLLAIDVLAKSAALMFAAVLIGLVVIRRPASSGAPGITPKVVAFLGAFLGVGILFLPHQKVAWELQLVSAVMIVGGMSFAVYALITLGRSISVLSEARKLVTAGPYANCSSSALSGRGDRAYRRGAAIRVSGCVRSPGPAIRLSALSHAFRRAGDDAGLPGIC